MVSSTRRLCTCASRGISATKSAFSTTEKPAAHPERLAFLLCSKVLASCSHQVTMSRGAALIAAPRSPHLPVELLQCAGHPGAVAQRRLEELVADRPAELR